MNDSIDETCATDAANGGVANGDNVGEQSEKSIYASSTGKRRLEHRDNISQNAYLDPANFPNLHIAIEPPTEIKSDEVCNKTGSPSASLPIQDQITKHTTVKEPIRQPKEENSGIPQCLASNYIINSMLIRDLSHLRWGFSE